ncbi:MAG TPA: trigger factor [Phnomibacter sp.]|nr:trigger factor [Phnomibacter sp.]
MATITRENVAPLTDRVTVTIAKDDIATQFNKALKTYSKKANLPGFRPGMVPMPVVKKMVGNSLFTDELLRLVEKEMNQYMDAEKPNMITQPLPTDDNATVLKGLDINQPTDYTFTFELGLAPEFSLPNLANATLNRLKVDITDAMVEEEVTNLQNRYGNMQEPETVNHERCVLNLMFEELGEDEKPKPGGIQKANSLLVNYFAPEVRNNWMGMKVGDNITATLEEAFEPKERDWVKGDLGLAEDADLAAITFKMEITKIGYVEPRALDAEFFEQLFPGKAIATEAEFRQAVKEDLAGFFDRQGRGLLDDQIFHYLMDHTQINFPEDFLKKYLQKGGEKPMTAEEAEAELPGLIKSLRWQYISGKIIADNQLQVQAEELRDYAKMQLMSYMGVTSVNEETAWLDAYADRMMQDRKFVKEQQERLIVNKIFAWAHTQIVNYNDEVVSAEEFKHRLESNHHHH